MIPQIIARNGALLIPILLLVPPAAPQARRAGSEAEGVVRAAWAALLAHDRVRFEKVADGPSLIRSGVAYLLGPAHGDNTYTDIYVSSPGLPPVYLPGIPPSAARGQFEMVFTEDFEDALRLALQSSSKEDRRFPELHDKLIAAQKELSIDNWRTEAVKGGYFVRGTLHKPADRSRTLDLRFFVRRDPDGLRLAGMDRNAAAVIHQAIVEPWKEPETARRITSIQSPPEYQRVIERVLPLKVEQKVKTADIDQAKGYLLKFNFLSDDGYPLLWNVKNGDGGTVAIQLYFEGGERERIAADVDDNLYCDSSPHAPVRWFPMRQFMKRVSAYPPIDLSQAARNAGTEGDVAVLTSVDASGKVTSTTIDSVPLGSPALQAVAEQFVKGLSFAPFVACRQARPQKGSYRVSFRLENSEAPTRAPALNVGVCTGVPRRIDAAEGRRLVESPPRIVYPPIAKMQRIQGTVQVLYTVSPSGKFCSAEIVSAHLQLRTAAREAAPTARFRAPGGSQPVSFIYPLQFLLSNQ